MCVLMCVGVGCASSQALRVAQLEIDDLGSQNARLQTAVTDAEQKLSQLQSMQVQGLKLDLQEAHKAVAEIQRAKDEAMVTCAALQRERDTLAAANQDLTCQMEGMR